MHGPALIGSALFLYQFLAHRCAILYTRIILPVFSRRILFFHPEESERLQGRPAYAAASPGAKRAKTHAVSYYLWEPSCIQVLFFGTDAAACPCCRLWTARRNCATPSLYTARPICRLTFPLGSDTISIKHRKGRPAPWPSS